MYESQVGDRVGAPGLLRADGGSDPISLDDVFDLLADRRRRYVLYELRDEAFLPLEELAERVAEREEGHGADRLPDDRADRVKIELHHHVLPKLDEAQLVDYDAQIGQVTADARFPLIEKYLELAEEDEAALP